MTILQVSKIKKNEVVVRGNAKKETKYQNNGSDFTYKGNTENECAFIQLPPSNDNITNGLSLF